jgi:hypothetical protein
MQNTTFIKKLEIEPGEFPRGCICGCTDTTKYQAATQYRRPEKSGTKPASYAPSFIILIRHAASLFLLTAAV